MSRRSCSPTCPPFFPDALCTLLSPRSLYVGTRKGANKFLMNIDPGSGDGSWSFATHFIQVDTSVGAIAADTSDTRAVAWGSVRDSSRPIGTPSLVVAYDRAPPVFYERAGSSISGTYPLLEDVTQQLARDHIFFNENGFSHGGFWSDLDHDGILDVRDLLPKPCPFFSAPV